MTEEILVNVTPFEVRVALVQQGAVQEFHLEREVTRGLAGNIYLGKVSRVLPGMQSAFIDIGLDRAAFLHVADLWQSRGGGQPVPIEKTLYEGQSLLVQVIKDPIGTKGARLSSQVSIAGRMLVYLPQDPHIGVSQRIASESERTMLRERIRQLMPPDEKGGFIVRTMAEEADDNALAADIGYLGTRWRQILEASKSKSAPSLLYQELGLRERVLRETMSGGVTVNDCLMHFTQEDLPFGGVGASGMGAYHGEVGFKTFSKDKPVFIQSRWSGVPLMHPPYGRVFRLMAKLLRRIG
jgi:ribonuclease G